MNAALAEVFLCLHEATTAGEFGLQVCNACGAAMPRDFIAGTIAPAAVPLQKARTWTTVSLKRFATLNRVPLEPEELDARRELAVRPLKRSDCIEGERPCPFMSCRYHLALEVTRAQSITMQDAPLDELAETCTLDVADRGGMTLEAVGGLLGLTRERVRQIEEQAAAKLRLRLEEP